MAIAVVQAHVVAATSTSVSTGTVTQPTSGNKLWAFLHVFSQTTITAVPDGWTLHEKSENAAGDQSQIFDIYVYTKTAGVGEPTSYAWTAGEFQYVVGFIELSDAGDPDVDADADSGFSNVTSQATGTTAGVAENGSLAVAFVAVLPLAVGPIAWTNSFNPEADNFASAGNNAGLATLPVDAAATPTTTLSWTTGDNAHGYILVVSTSAVAPIETTIAQGLPATTQDADSGLLVSAVMG